MQIDLSRRNLIEFDSSAFSTDGDREILCTISHLDLSFNSISSLHSLCWLSALTALDVSHNSIASLRGLPSSLRQLNASFNVLHGVEGLSSLLQLEVLVVSHNQITNLMGIPATVRILDASSNRLASAAGVEKCTVLEELQLRQNMIQNVEGLRALNFLSSLKAVTLSENPVTCSRRRCYDHHVAAVYALLPQSLEFHDLPPALATMRSSIPSDMLGNVYPGDTHSTASCDASRASNTMNVSAVAIPRTERLSAESSSCRSHSRPSPPFRLMSPQSVGADAHYHNEGQDVEARVIPYSAEEYLTAAVQSSLMSGDASLLHEVSAASSNVNTSNDTGLAQCVKWQLPCEAGGSATAISGREQEHFMLKKLRLELRECQGFCTFYKKENAELRLRIQQLQSTNEQQARTNTMLLEWIGKLQHGDATGGGYKQERCEPLVALHDGGHLADDSKSLASSRGELWDPEGNTRDQNGSDLPYQSHGVEEAGGKKDIASEGTLPREKAELRRGAQSLAALIMSLVPRSTDGSLTYRSDSAAADNSDEHQSISQPIEISEHGIHGDNDSGLRQSPIGGGKSRKRSVSFGAFAYYSPPP